MKEDQESAKPQKVTESRRKPNKFKGRQRILKEDQKVTESGRKPKQILRKAKNLEGRPGVRRIAEGQENPEGSQNKKI